MRFALGAMSNVPTNTVEGAVAYRQERGAPVIRSLNTAEQALQRQQVQIDALANNLANVNSTGFRQILTRIAERENPGGAQTQQPTIAGANRATAGRTVNTPIELSMEHAVDIRPGAIRSTGRDTDVALLGPGFFAVQTSDGERYTRAGSFLINAEKQLTLPSGEPVLGTGGPITIDGQSFSFEPGGAVIVDGQQVDQLKIVDFKDATRLMHQGANLLDAPADMPAKAVPTEQIELAQGQLEGSNVDPITTLVAMIEAQRAFEIQTHVMTTEDEMLEKAVNNLPRVG